MVNFMDNDHKSFFYSKLNKLQVLGKTDVYYLSLVYTLSICETTREHFSNIFNIEKGEINLVLPNRINPSILNPPYRILNKIFTNMRICLIQIYSKSCIFHYFRIIS